MYNQDSRQYLSHEQNNWIYKSIENTYEKIKSITPIEEHADKRCYYRIKLQSSSFICMKANEGFNFDPVIAKTNLLKKENIPSPTIIKYNRDLKLIIFSDLGNISLLKKAKKKPSDYITDYIKTIDLLIKFQKIYIIDKNISSYSREQVIQNCNLARNWFSSQLYKKPFTNYENFIWNKAINNILSTWKQIPKCITHKDFHADNIMLHSTTNNNPHPYMLDYQCMEYAPFLYDITSLITDHYISIPQDYKNILINHYIKNNHISKLYNISTQQTLQWIDYISMQRHLKNIGIFARLATRDNKKQYLKHIPRMLQHMEEISQRQPTFTPLVNIIIKRYIQNTVKH